MTAKGTTKAVAKAAAVTVPQETLTCEHPAKPHKWKRDAGQRGRKPRLCPKHKPVGAVVTVATAKELHCEAGDHTWIREPTRGRVPTNCPKHRAAVTIVAAPRNDNGKEELTCEVGNHTWERLPARGRKPRFCPNHPAGNAPSAPVTEPKKAGRPKLYANKEEQTEAQLAHSRERATLLEGALKERGTHISQQTPYVLYRKVKETPNRTKGGDPTTEWVKVADHSPLAQAQYINQHEKDFLDGSYRYERDGKVVIL